MIADFFVQLIQFSDEETMTGSQYMLCINTESFIRDAGYRFSDVLLCCYKNGTDGKKQDCGSRVKSENDVVYADGFLLEQGLEGLE